MDLHPSPHGALCQGKRKVKGQRLKDRTVLQRCLYIFSSMVSESLSQVSVRGCLFVFFLKIFPLRMPPEKCPLYTRFLTRTKKVSPTRTCFPPEGGREDRPLVASPGFCHLKNGHHHRFLTSSPLVSFFFRSSCNFSVTANSVAVNVSWFLRTHLLESATNSRGYESEAATEHVLVLQDNDP